MKVRINNDITINAWFNTANYRGEVFEVAETSDEHYLITKGAHAGKTIYKHCATVQKEVKPQSIIKGKLNEAITNLLNEALNQAICIQRIKPNSNSIAEFVDNFLNETDYESEQEQLFEIEIKPSQTSKENGLSWYVRKPPQIGETFICKDDCEYYYQVVEGKNKLHYIHKEDAKIIRSFIKVKSK